MSGNYTVCWKDAIYEGGVPDPHLFKENLADGQAPITKTGLHGSESHIVQFLTIVIDNNN